MNTIVAALLSALCGLAWGFLGALVNYKIMKKGLESKDSKKVMKMMIYRMLIDIVWLGAVFAVRKLGAVHFSAAIVATAAALSMGTIFFTFKLAGKTDGNSDKENKA